MAHANSIPSVPSGNKHISFLWMALSSFLFALCMAGCTTSYSTQNASGVSIDRIQKVACAGDSITFGTGLPNRENESYPVILASQLGPNWQVENFGVEGIRALDYGQSSAFKHLQEYAPDLVVVLLGSNDVKFDWPGISPFRAGYAQLVETIRQIPSVSRILLCRPLPRHNGTDSQDLLSEEAEAITSLGKQMGLEVVYLDKRFWNKPNLFSDGVHPSVRGARVLADEVQRAIEGKATTFGDRFRSVGEYFQPGAGLGKK